MTVLMMNAGCWLPFFIADWSSLSFYYFLFKTIKLPHALIGLMGVMVHLNTNTSKSVGNPTLLKGDLLILNELPRRFEWLRLGLLDANELVLPKTGTS